MRLQRVANDHAGGIEEAGAGGAIKNEKNRGGKQICEGQQADARP